MIKNSSKSAQLLMMTTNKKSFGWKIMKNLF